jgi:hypothetical protein
VLEHVVGIEGAPRARQNVEGSHFRGEGMSAPVLHDVQRPHAVAVSARPQRSSLAVVVQKGELSVALSKPVDTKPHQRQEQHFRVALGLEGFSQRCQLGAQLDVVEDFAVVDQRMATADERLVAIVHVDDGESHVSERHARQHIAAVGIGASMGKLSEHSNDLPATRAGGVVIP